MSNYVDSKTDKPNYFFPNKCLYYNMLLNQCFKNNRTKKERNNNCGELLEKMEKFGCFFEFTAKPKLYPYYPAEFPN